MFELKQVYCFADPLFFEDVSRWNGGPGFLPDGDLTISGRPAPDGWQRDDRGIWISLKPTGARGPEQGWKIHVSATPKTADRICSAVWDYCVPRGIRFKHLRNRSVLVALNAKYAPRSASGKMVTIYPVDEAALRMVLDELGERIGRAEGPYILSDLRWDKGPLYVRYGGFVPMECIDERGEVVHGIRRPDGVLVPDVRRPVFDPPKWAPLPAFLESHLVARRSSSGTSQPYRVQKTLHFSNAGGVYLATRLTDGATVVLKEARPHAGLDDNHEDSVARMHRERRALEILGGLDGIPALYDHFVLGEHHFLVQEFIDAQPLHVWSACTHPWVVSAEPTEADFAEYTKRALAICDRVADLIAAVHSRGVVFGDLHMGNVMVRADDSVALIDFELAFDSNDLDWRPGLGATGFTDRNRSGVDIDRYAFAALRLGLFVTLNRLTVLDPGKAGQFAREAERHFPLPAGWSDEIIAELTPAAGNGRETAPLNVDLDAPRVDWPAAQRSIVRAIMRSATPERTDRLYPGDSQLFTVGGLGIAYGAAGVLWALDVTGHGRHLDHERWLLDAVAAAKTLRPGFYDGAAGVAYVLDHLGHRDQARATLERFSHEKHTTVGMSLYSGLAGIGLNLVHFAARTDSGELRARAAGIGERLAAAVRADNPRLAFGSTEPPGRLVDAGLMRGWSGVALFLLRLYRETRDPAWLDVAVQAVHRDLDRCIVTSDGSLQVEEVGVRTLGYLVVGSAGIATVIDELLDVRDDERARQSLPGLLSACSRGFVIQSDLFHGRAGLMATLGRLSHRHDVSRALDRHLARLSWHAISYKGDLAFPGDLDFRLSMDLATGGAGMLLAVNAATKADAEFLPFLTPRGRSLRAK
jgi:tRNA A-37 threonylcarbamoyl transferase component Bud32